MTEEREAICRKCKMLPSIHHLDFPYCYQPMGPINEDEYEYLGAAKDDLITLEGLWKMLEISTKDYCRRLMKNSPDFCLNRWEAERRAKAKLNENH
jgi:hypothetical protein